MTTAPNSIPRHVAIIMDGNGRWARQRNLPRVEGHRRGARAVRAAIEAAKDAGVRFLTLYAFSSENWNRPKDEVDALMDMLADFLRRETKTLLKHQIRLLAIGRLAALPEKTRSRLEKTIAATAAFNGPTLVLALNYGSRDEVLDAANAYARDIAAGKIPPSNTDWLPFARHLSTASIPDPDLVIRTSGEIRLSNFLLLQSAYAELLFLPVLWPDFDKACFAEAVAEYARRERRYGLTSEQLPPPSE